ncbi:DNA replication licensing factor MCM2 [Artemisia annua]|uniref:DNA replication licensing factor MCM2 n=1 Tax=Artemisia annua TaxID=35608 RepID=A0A2U1L791_ARTAN|nr:DNA replication licensing factor MCM2 [Artemisia annua]
MSSNPDTIDISSDSSSSEPTSTGWANYFPHNASNSLTKRSKKKGKEPIASDDLPILPPYVSDSSSSELPSYAPSFHSDDKEPLVLAINEESVTSMRRIPKLKPAKQVLGLSSTKEIRYYRAKGPLIEWVTKEEVRVSIARRLRKHLQPEHAVRFEALFEERLENAMAANKCSLEIDHRKLLMADPLLAVWLSEAPQPFLEVMEAVFNGIVFNRYPAYKEFVNISMLGVSHLENWNVVRGLATRVPGVLTWSDQTVCNLTSLRRHFDINKIVAKSFFLKAQLDFSHKLQQLILCPLSSLFFASDICFFNLASDSLPNVPLSSRCLASDTDYLGDTSFFFTE